MVLAVATGTKEDGKRAVRDRERCLPERARKYLNVIGSYGHVTEENRPKFCRHISLSRTNIDLL